MGCWAFRLRATWPPPPGHPDGRRAQNEAARSRSCPQVFGPHRHPTAAVSPTRPAHGWADGLYQRAIRRTARIIGAYVCNPTISPTMPPTTPAELAPTTTARKAAAAPPAPHAVFSQVDDQPSSRLASPHVRHRFGCRWRIRDRAQITHHRPSKSGRATIGGRR